MHRLGVLLTLLLISVSAAACVWKSGCPDAVVQPLWSLLRSSKNGRDTPRCDGAEDNRQQDGLLTDALAEEAYCASSRFCCFFSARIFVTLTWRLSDLFVKIGTNLRLAAGWALLSKEWLAETDKDEENDGREVKDDVNWHVSVPWQWEDCKMGLGIWGFPCTLVVAGRLMLLRPTGWLRGHGADANCERGTLSGEKTLGSWVSTSLLELLEVRLEGKAPESWKSKWKGGRKIYKDIKFTLNYRHILNMFFLFNILFFFVKICKTEHICLNTSHTRLLSWVFTDTATA